MSLLVIGSFEGFLSVGMRGGMLWPPMDPLEGLPPGVVMAVKVSLSLSNLLDL